MVKFLHLVLLQKNNAVDTMKFLIKNGADLTSEHPHYSPLAIAKENNSYDAIKLLEKELRPEENGWKQTGDLLVNGAPTITSFSQKDGCNSLPDVN